MTAMARSVGLRGAWLSAVGAVAGGLLAQSAAGLDSTSGVRKRPLAPVIGHDPTAAEEHDMSGDLTDLRDVALLAGRAEDVSHTLRTALDALAEVVAYDLAAVLEIDGDRLVVRCASGRLASAQVANHGIDLATSPLLRAALQGGHPRIFAEADHDMDHGGEGDPYHGVVELPHGHACLVAPLVAGGRTIGAMTFDRAVCERYDESTVALVTVYAQLVAMALELAHRNSELQQCLIAKFPPPPPVLPPPPPPEPEPLLTLEASERKTITRALQACHGKVYGEDGAAAVLGLAPSTLQHRMRKLGIAKTG
jgi:transcriptional regulator with GAF, ATPase, and Fis domain